MSHSAKTKTLDQFATTGSNSKECISESLDLLPTESQAMRMTVGVTMNGTTYTGYGLYAKVPGKKMIFLSPVWTSQEDYGRKTVNAAARLDALELLNEFQIPGLSITLRNVETRQLRANYGAESWESGFDLLERG